MNEINLDQEILDELIAGRTYREIAEKLEIGNNKIKSIRDTNLDKIPKKRKQTRTKSKNQNITQSTPDKAKEFLSYFKDRRPHQQNNPIIAQKSAITQKEKEHLRECLIAGNHQRSFSRDMMKEALKILDKI